MALQILTVTIPFYIRRKLDVEMVDLGRCGEICVIRFLSNFEYITIDHRVVSIGFKRTCVEYIKVKNNKQIESVCVGGEGVAILIKTLNKQKENQF